MESNPITIVALLLTAGMMFIGLMQYMRKMAQSNESRRELLFDELEMAKREIMARDAEKMRLVHSITDYQMSARRYRDIAIKYKNLYEQTIDKPVRNE